MSTTWLCADERGFEVRNEIDEPQAQLSDLASHAIDVRAVLFLFVDQGEQVVERRVGQLSDAEVRVDGTDKANQPERRVGSATRQSCLSGDNVQCLYRSVADLLKFFPKEVCHALVQGTLTEAVAFESRGHSLCHDRTEAFDVALDGLRWKLHQDNSILNTSFTQKTLDATVIEQLIDGWHVIQVGCGHEHPPSSSNYERASHH